MFFRRFPVARRFLSRDICAWKPLNDSSVLYADDPAGGPSLVSNPTLYGYGGLIFSLSKFERKSTDFSPSFKLAAMNYKGLAWESSFRVNISTFAEELDVLMKSEPINKPDSKLFIDYMEKPSLLRIRAFNSTTNDFANITLFSLMGDKAEHVKTNINTMLSVANAQILFSKE